MYTIQFIRGTGHDTSITVALEKIKAVYKIEDHNTKIVHTNYQKINGNSVVWLLTLFEKTLLRIKNDGQDFFSLNLEEIMQKLLFTPEEIKPEFILEKCCEYNEIYKTVQSKTSSPSVMMS